MLFYTRMSIIDSANTCSSLRSAISNGIDLTLIGIESRQVGWKKSPELLLKVLKTYNDRNKRDIIVFNDGPPVLYAANKKQIEDAFLKIETGNSVIFSAEKICTNYSCTQKFSNSTSPYKYAHYGSFIGRRKEVMKLLVAWMLSYNSLPRDTDEQLALLQLLQPKYVSKDFTIKIDNGCNIFQTLSSSQLDSSRWAIANPHDPYFQQNGQLYNAETATEPLMYRFSKGSNVSEIANLMWRYQNLDKRFALKFKFLCLAQLKRNPFMNDCIAEPSVVLNCGIEGEQHRIQHASLGIDRNWYPDTIPNFSLRVDITSNKSVSRGRMILLNGGKQYPLVEYKKILQCPLHQPDLHNKGGALSLKKFIPLTAETLMMTAAYLETDCTLWNGCRDVVSKCLSGFYPSTFNLTRHTGMLSSSKLFRVINGTFYYDWPWGIDRLEVLFDLRSINYKGPIHDILKRVSDIPDSVFFAGGEESVLPSNIPVPHFSSSPTGSASSDIPGVWNPPFMYEKKRSQKGFYESVTTQHDKQVLEEQFNSNVETNRFPSSWDLRLDKAAFFGSMGTTSGLADHAAARQVVYDIAADFPQHVDAGYTKCHPSIQGIALRR